MVLVQGHQRAAFFRPGPMTRAMLLVDVAMMLVDGWGGDRRHQHAAPPRADAGAGGIGADGVPGRADYGRLQWIQVAKARSRRHMWKQLPAMLASHVAYTDLDKVVALDVDAILVTPHSEKGPVPPHSRVVLG